MWTLYYYNASSLYYSLPTSESTGLSKRTVEEANKSVSKTLERKGKAAGCKRKATQHSETRTKLGKYAAVHEVAAVQRHFKKELGDLPESTLRKYKTLYTKELAVRDKRNDTSEITALVQRKRGRPLSLGVNLDTEVQRYILVLRHAMYDLEDCMCNSCIFLAYFPSADILKIA